MKRKSKKFLNAVMVLSVAMLWQAKARGEEIIPTSPSNNVVVATETGEYKIYKTKELEKQNKPEKEGKLRKNQDIYGGKSSGIVGNNEVSITKAGEFDSVYGGLGKEEASENKVTIKDSKNLESSIYGGKSEEWGYVESLDAYVYKGKANKNKVNISGLSNLNKEHYYDKDVVGGYGGLEANENEVTIEGKNTNGEIYGGYSSSGKANINKTTIIRADEINRGAIHGGEGATKANENEVIIRKSKNIGSLIYGGEGRKEAQKNTVSITGLDELSKISKDIYGGSSSGIANENTVTISEVEEFSNIAIYGGLGKEEASENKVTIKDSKNLESSIYGGKSEEWGYVESLDAYVYKGKANKNRFCQI